VAFVLARGAPDPGAAIVQADHAFERVICVVDIDVERAHAVARVHRTLVQSCGDKPSLILVAPFLGGRPRLSLPRG
jgi:hypothetical protein